jgi:hypothetical protein
MEQNRLKYFSQLSSKPYSDQQQLITYSFNEHERTIVGYMEEIGEQVYLYEYRGGYIGTEFFISFSRRSISYKLISVDKVTQDVKPVAG